MANADLRRESGHVGHRARHADAESPSLFTEIDDEADLRHLFTEYDDLPEPERNKNQKNRRTRFLGIGHAESL